MPNDQPVAVLVAGSAYELTDKIIVTSKKLGCALADRGFNLISGGWEGVDHLAARAFAESLKEVDGKLSERIVQFMKRGCTPDFPGGRFKSFATENDAWEASVMNAQVIILIGGLGGTYESGLMARRQGKPVLPLADTRCSGEVSHGDAYNFYFKILESWATQPIAGLTEEEFSELAGPAPEVVGDCMNLLVKLFGRQPNEATSNRRLSHTQAAVALWREKLAYLMEQEAITFDPAMKFKILQDIKEAQAKIMALRGQL